MTTQQAQDAPLIARLNAESECTCFYLRKEAATELAHLSAEVERLTGINKRLRVVAGMSDGAIQAALAAQDGTPTREKSL